MPPVIRFRNPSPVQFIDTMRQLADHTVFYAARLPKSHTFTYRNPLSQLALEACVNCVRANSVYLATEQDFITRRNYLLAAYANLDALEEMLHVIAIRYYEVIAPRKKRDDEKEKEEQAESEEEQEDYPWLRWGKLISEEREQLKKVMQSDLQRLEKTRRKTG